MEETMNGKIVYERFAHNHGVKIKNYQGDNMRYIEANFVTSCNKWKHVFDYCGV